MEQPEAGFREIEHTADWELLVWAPDLPGLFEQAARGLYALSQARLAPVKRIRQRLEMSAIDRESLLVKFLNELLYMAEYEHLGYEDFSLGISETAEGEIHLAADLIGATLENLSKEIKAVTYYKLAIRPGEHGLQTSLVVDV